MIGGFPPPTEFSAVTVSNKVKTLKRWVFVVVVESLIQTAGQKVCQKYSCCFGSNSGLLLQSRNKAIFLRNTAVNMGQSNIICWLNIPDSSVSCLHLTLLWLSESESVWHHFVVWFKQFTGENVMRSCNITTILKRWFAVLMCLLGWVE